MNSPPTFMTIIIFILVLAVLIFVHELGHFLVARACGIRVDAFKIGFGPKIITWKRGETEYGINWIPFGGYVKIHGENPDEESVSGSDASRSFVNKPRWQQALVLSAGVFFNFVFAWLIYMIVFMSGMTASTSSFEKYTDRFGNQRIMITHVGAGSPAETSGLKVGDVIDSVYLRQDSTDQAPSVLNAEEVQTTINTSVGEPVIIKHIREDIILTTEIIPKEGIVEGRYAIGIAMDNVADINLPFLASIKESLRYTGFVMKETAIGLYTFLTNIFRGQANFSDVAGPIGIAGIVGNAATLGFTYLLMITALISINLGIINLIPFPALDGGRLLFVAIEGIIRRRIPMNIANITNAVGFILLMILMLIVTYRDVLKLVD